MDLFSLSLQIHLAGAFSLASLLVLTVGTLYRAPASTRPYKVLAIALAVATAVEVATGSAMYVLVTDSSLVSFCGKMAIYLSLTAIAEFALISKLRNMASVEA